MSKPLDWKSPGRRKRKPPGGHTHYCPGCRRSVLCDRVLCKLDPIHRCLLCSTGSGRFSVMRVSRRFVLLRGRRNIVSIALVCDWCEGVQKVTVTEMRRFLPGALGEDAYVSCLKCRRKLLETAEKIRGTAPMGTFVREYAPEGE